MHSAGAARIRVLLDMILCAIALSDDRQSQGISKVGIQSSHSLAFIICLYGENAAGVL